MKLLATFAVILVAMVQALVPASASGDTDPPARKVDGRVNDWRGKASRFGGTSQYSGGEFV